MNLGELKRAIGSEYMATPKEVQALIVEVERLKAENYNDLLDQMDAKGWNNFHEINTEEVYAFINSRTTHKPTTKLRTENKRLREALEAAVELIEELIPYKSDYLVEKHDDKGELARIKEALKEGE